MTVRDLHVLGSPVLRQRAAPVAAVDDEVPAPLPIRKPARPLPKPDF